MQIIVFSSLASRMKQIQTHRGANLNQARPLRLEVPPAVSGKVQPCSESIHSMFFKMNSWMFRLHLDAIICNHLHVHRYCYLSGRSADFIWIFYVLWEAKQSDQAIPTNQHIDLSNSLLVRPMTSSAANVNLTEKKQGWFHLWPSLTSANLCGQYPAKRPGDIYKQWRERVFFLQHAATTNG